jgi:NADPH-dependent curcumin reductase
MPKKTPVILDEVNTQWRIARRPTGNNVQRQDFSLHEENIPACGDGQVLLRTLYLNLAPVMRMYMMGVGAAREKPLGIGDVIHGRGVAEVVESHHPDYRVGDIVQGQLGWQTYKTSAMTAAELMRKIPDRGVSYGLSLGPLGMTGFSAYFGFIDRGSPKKGDTVVVSAAAGGVGSIVIQIAKIYGCRVIGIAGGPEKCNRITQWCDDTIDYRNENVPARLEHLLPNGFDIYFDNVGGDTLDACMDNMNAGARIVLCGSISEYTTDEPYGLKNYARLRSANASMLGFFVYNYEQEFAQAEEDLATWILSGELTALVDVVEGFEAMPEGLARLYSHKNIGPAYCRVQGDCYDLE